MSNTALLADVLYRRGCMTKFRMAARVVVLQWRSLGRARVYRCRCQHHSGGVAHPTTNRAHLAELGATQTTHALLADVGIRAWVTQGAQSDDHRTKVAMR